MQENIVELIKLIVVPIVTGIITFLITRYTYRRNRPIDKLQIAYCRIYYPIIKMIKEQGKEVDYKDIAEEIEKRLKKYYIYADPTTINLFDLFEQAVQNKRNIDKLYNSLYENIYNNNAKLRMALGYLQPNIYQLYKSFSTNIKFKIRIILEITFFCVCICTCIFWGSIDKKYIEIFIWPIIIIIVIIVLELVAAVLCLGGKKIEELIIFLREKLKEKNK